MTRENAELKEFGARVRQIRLKRGWSQEDLAEHTALDRTYISAIERGARNVTLKTMTRIAAALQVPTGQLLQ